MALEKKLDEHGREYLPFQNRYIIPLMGMFCYMWDAETKKRYLTPLDGTRLVVNQVVELTAIAWLSSYVIPVVQHYLHK